VTPDQTIEAIARELLFVETLATRTSDALDFHDVAVWQLAKALRAAYDAGRASAAAAKAPRPGRGNEPPGRPGRDGTRRRQPPSEPNPN
jgi:hypothetical protein